MDQSQGPLRPRGVTNPSPQTARPQPHGKQRKSSRLGNVLRKLLGRKSIESENSLPVSTRESERSPFGADPITSIRDQRAVSLPARHVTRQSVLASNPSYVETVQEEESPRTPRQLGGGPSAWRPQHQPRSRRASEPGAVSPALDRHAFSTTALPAGQRRTDVDADDIGYAVTSGSHPKRRSRSAGMLHDLAKEAAQTQPDSPERTRRRSDEIRHLRNSLAIGPSIYGEPEEEPMQREFRLQAPRSAFSVSDFGDSEVHDDEKEMVTPEIPGNHQSFDFNAIATTMNAQESIPIEERMMIVEIKLMDLENAIAKGRSPSPPSATTATPRPGDAKMVSREPLAESSIVYTPEKKGAKPSPTYSKSEPRTGSAASAVSTQPTTSSLGTDPSHNKDIDPFVESNDRPTSKVPAQQRSSGEATESSNSSRTKQPRPVSLTSITIDHYATLISLVRREQHARIRLENQVAELQRELFHFMHPQTQPEHSSSPISMSSANPPSLYRSRRWDGSRKDVVKIDDFHVSKRRKSYEEESGGPVGVEGDRPVSEDEGYPDVFETPTQQQRKEFGGKQWGLNEGEAF